MTKINYEIHIQGQTLPVTLPDFATREELVEAYASSGETSRSVGYVLTAISGICCPELVKDIQIGSYEEVLDPLRWGRALYSKLREQGIETSEVMTQGASLLTVILKELYPREDEVSQGKPSTPLPEEDRI